MSKTPIAEAAKAIAAVRELQDAVGAHTEAIAELIRRLDRIETRLDELRTAAAS